MLQLLLEKIGMLVIQSASPNRPDQGPGNGGSCHRCHDNAA